MEMRAAVSHDALSHRIPHDLRHAIENLHAANAYGGPEQRRTALLDRDANFLGNARGTSRESQPRLSPLGRAAGASSDTAGYPF